MVPVRKEVPQPFTDTCVVVDDVFTEEECQGFISRLVEPLKIDTTTSEDLLRIVERTSLKVFLTQYFSISYAVWKERGRRKEEGGKGRGDRSSLLKSCFRTKN
jgi:hypothetical protein